MASRNQIRKQYKRWHAQYSRAAYKELQKTFKKWGNAIPYTMLTEQNYEALIRLVITDAPMEKTYFEIYSKIGLVHGARVGRAVNRELKFFDPNTFDSVFLANIREFLSAFVGDRIVSVENTYFEAITTILRTRLDEGKTIQQASKELQEVVGKNNFYRWQAERIARTETTAAANYSAVQAGDSTTFVMEKVWISGLDERTRTTPPDKYDHRHMNGKTVKPNDNFVTSRGELLEYPGDPKGSAGNVVNCRCTVAFRAVRDSEGNLIDK